MRRAKQIVNLHSESGKAKRVFDAVIYDDSNEAFIELKTSKGKIEKVPWDDITYQVEDFIKECKKA